MLSIENLFCRLCVLEEIDGRVSEGFKLILSQRYLSPLPKIKQTKKTPYDPMEPTGSWLPSPSKTLLSCYSFYNSL